MKHEPEPIRFCQIPADRAILLVREIAEAHRARHIIKHLGEIRTDRVARARSGFAQGMSDDEIPLLLVDSSFWRNGNSGFLLTNRAFYSNHLPRPILLRAIRSVARRPPDHRIRTLIHVGIVIAHVFPPALLLLLPLGLVDRDRFRDALMINEQVAYVDINKKLTWGFWLDLLPALAAEFDEWTPKSRVAVLEVLPLNAEALSTTDPSSEVVEHSLRALDDAGFHVVRLWIGTPDRSAGLEIVGGNGRYSLRELPDGWVYYDPASGDEEIELLFGEPGHRYPAYSVCTDLERVIEIARGFAETGSFE